jgi:cell division protein FtsA
MNAETVDGGHENKKPIVGLDINVEDAVNAAEVKPNGGFEIIGMGGHPSKDPKRGGRQHRGHRERDPACSKAERADCKISEVFTGIAGSHIKSINWRGMVATGIMKSQQA